MSSRVHRLSCLACWFAFGLTIWLGILAHDCRAQSDRDDPDALYVAGLRSRGLFSLAERHCLQRLAEPALDQGARVWLTVELSQCFAEHATYRTGREQEELWSRAESVVVELLSQGAELPGRERLILQQATVTAAHGTWLRWRSELSPYDEALRQRAIAELQTAHDALKESEKAFSRSEGAPGNSRHVLAEAKFRTAVTSLDLARLLVGIERTAALHDAESRLRELSRSPNLESRATSVKLLQAMTARLRSDYSTAMNILDPLGSSEFPTAVRRLAAAESMRVELDRGQPEAALLQLKEIEKSTGSVSDELLCVGLEARLALRLRLIEDGETARAATLLEEAVTINERIQAPWRALSEALLERSRSGDELGPELAPLVLAARAAQQHGDSDTAIARFQEAAEAAQRAGRNEVAMEMTYVRAALLLDAERYEDAATGFNAVADGDSRAARAADAHLLLAYCRGKQWEARATQANREAYAAALAEHLQRFAGQQTQIEATWMLAAFHEVRLQWTEALTLYESIPPTHARAAVARVRISVLYRQILDRLRQTGQPTAEWERRAAEQIRGFVQNLPAHPGVLSLQEAEAAVGFARIALQLQLPDASACDSLLNRVIDTASEIRRSESDAASGVAAQWSKLEQSAEQLLIVSLAARDRVKDAQQLLSSMSGADPQSALAVLDGLCNIGDSAAPDRQAILGELQLQAAEQLHSQRATLSVEEQQRLDRCLAQALAAVGRPNDAARAFRRQLERAPEDKTVLATAAQGIAALQTPDAIREAKALWRRLEALEQPGSPAWLKARLEVARCCEQLEELEECRKLLKVTRLLYPDLGGAELKTQFDKLAAELSHPN